MSIVGNDPLSFVLDLGGLVSTPLEESAATGAENLDVAQQGAAIGEVIPVVFCRRVGGVGGVLVSPLATEARFENDANNAVTAYYHLVLGEGQMDFIQVRDVFQRSCRVGSFSQTYNRRAGTWAPGNFIVPRAGYDTPQCPIYCGTSGYYSGLSTLSYVCTYPDGVDQWNRQVHCFIRGGLYVPRLLDSVTGPSNNVADLLLYLLRTSSRVPEAQIDTAGLLAAATFTDANGFWFNGQLKESTNLRDWVGDTLQYFLLRQARVSGKESLKPLLPTNANGTIKTSGVAWVFTFTEEHIIPESFEIIYTSLADRKPFCALVLWRQQDDNGIGVVRTAEVRYAGTAEDGPFEQHDLSAFCASENHAVKVGAYIVSKRNHVTHRLQLNVKPDAFNATLSAGDLVRVRLERTASTGAASLHDYLYEVDQISKSLAGDIRLNLTHFPVDANYASVVAQEVNTTTGTGLLLPTGLSNVTCDINSPSDTSIPAETFTIGTFPDFEFSFNGFNASGLNDPPIDNPEDSPLFNNTITGTGEVGSPLSYDPGCPGAYIEWRLRDLTTGLITVVGSGISAGLTVADQWVGNELIGVGKCPDPSSPTGYGEEIISQPLVITFNPNNYAYYRWTGTVYTSDYQKPNPTVLGSQSYTMPWRLRGTGESGTWLFGTSTSGWTPRDYLPSWTATETATWTPPGAFISGSSVFGLIRLVNGEPPVSNLVIGGFFGVNSFAPVSGPIVFKVEGKWQFSNNASTVVAEWDGV